MTNVWVCKANTYLNNDVLGCNLSSVNWLKCILMNNQECKVRPQISIFNSEEPMFFSF